MANGRLMAKVFDLESRTVGEDGKPKGASLQSKINSFTSGKNIAKVHDLSLFVNAEGRTQAHLLFEAGEGEGDRVYAKVIEGRAAGSSDLQTAVNSWSKGKTGEVLGASSLVNPDETVLLVILHTKGAGDTPDAAADTPDAATAPAEAEPVAV